MLETVEIQQKLARLAQYLDELEQLGHHPFREFRENFQVKRAVERPILTEFSEYTKQINAYIRH